MKLPKHVHLIEVGPRDGLQNEQEFVPTSAKIALIDRLAAAGLPNIEAGAFVSPRWVPQMADSAEVLHGIVRRPGTHYSVLVPNLKGFERALAAHVQEVVIFGAASEAFSHKNINCSIGESIARFTPVAQAAKAAGLSLRGSISCSLGCPYQGMVTPEAVADVAQRLADLGCDMIDIADTIGVGTAGQVQQVIAAVAKVFPIPRLSCHFHDTYGQALTNIYAALQSGITTFHSSVAGLGGCPYARGATGNVATEDVLVLLNGLGIETGVDLLQVVEAGDFITRILQQQHPQRRNASRAGNALLARRQHELEAQLSH